MYDYDMRKSDEDLLDQLIYRGEGNSSIVIALKDKLKVIRLLKKDGKIMKLSQDHCLTQHPLRSIRFIHSIMRPLMSPYLSNTTELVHLKSDFISSLSKKVEAERPAHRLDKTLDLDDQYALVMDDLCTLPLRVTKNLQETDFIGPTISVEIKPKQGFLSPTQRSTFMQSCPKIDKVPGRLTSSCLYGLNQHFKLARGIINKMSNYCPLNLFSGCPIKMRNALQALLDNPQNNFRIFKDRILAYDETEPQAMSNLFRDGQTNNHELAHEKSIDISKEQLIDILIQCLLSEPTVVENVELDEKETLFSDPHGEDDENIFSSKITGDQCTWHSLSSNSGLCDVYQCSRDRRPVTNLVSTDLTHKLPRSCVLACVLRAQRLDTIGPFEARNMLEWLMEDSKHNRIDSSRFKKDVLEELSKPRLPEGFGVRSQLHSESKRDYYFRKVWEFLVSLTAKDCSIMITIRQITIESYELLQKRMFGDNLLIDRIRGCCYVYHIGIADFDQKMPLKIMKICENLNQMVHLATNLENISPVLQSELGSNKQSDRDVDRLLLMN